MVLPLKCTKATVTNPGPAADTSSTQILLCSTSSNFNSSTWGDSTYMQCALGNPRVTAWISAQDPPGLSQNELAEQGYLILGVSGKSVCF